MEITAKKHEDQIQHASIDSESSELNWNIELKLRATTTTPSQGIYRKGKRRSDSIRTNKFINSLNVITHLN